MKTVLKLGLLSKNCYYNIIKRAQLWQRLIYRDFQDYAYHKPISIDWIYYYYILKSMQENKFPLTDKPESMSRQDYFKNLLLSGNLEYQTVYHHNNDDPESEYSQIIATNVCRIWIDTDNNYLFYLDIFGTLFSDKDLTNNALRSYILDETEQQTTYIPILTEIIEIAPDNIHNILILDVHHDLYGIGSKYHPSELILISTKVQRVWSDPNKIKYYYLTDNFDIYMLNMNNIKNVMNIEPQLTVNIPIAPINNHSVQFKYVDHTNSYILNTYLPYSISSIIWCIVIK